MEWIGFQGRSLQDTGSGLDGRKQLMDRRYLLNGDNKSEKLAGEHRTRQDYLMEHF